MNKKTSIFSVIFIVAVFTVLEVISVLLISKNSIVQRYKIIELIKTSQAFFWNRGENIKAYFDLRDANERLVLENEELKNHLEMVKRSIPSKMEEFDSSIMDSSYNYISAKVIKNSTNKPHNSIIINKGRNQGIEEDMGVVTSNGIIGYVHSVGSNFARIVSFLDINNNIGAIIKSNHTFGALKWEGLKRNQAVLKEIPIHTTINKGDTIVTSGYSITYPPNIPLGVIESYEIIDGVNYDVTIKLFENYSSLEYVYVVKYIAKSDIKRLQNWEDSK